MNRTLLLKTAVVAALSLVLMLPIGMIRDLVKERQERRDQAVAGIAEGWGKRQVLAGPYLVLPYERSWTEVRRETVNGQLREAKNERSDSRLLRLPASAVEWTVSAEISE